MSSKQAVEEKAKETRNKIYVFVRKYIPAAFLDGKVI